MRVADSGQPISQGITVSDCPRRAAMAAWASPASPDQGHMLMRGSAYEFVEMQVAGAAVAGDRLFRGALTGVIAPAAVDDLGPSGSALRAHRAREQGRA